MVRFAVHVPVLVVVPADEERFAAVVVAADVEHFAAHVAAAAVVPVRGEHFLALLVVHVPAADDSTVPWLVAGDLTPDFAHALADPVFVVVHVLFAGFLTFAEPEPFAEILPVVHG